MGLKGHGTEAWLQLSWMVNSEGTEAGRKARGLNSEKSERMWGGLGLLGKDGGRSCSAQEINGQRQGPHAPLREDFQDP